MSSGNQEIDFTTNGDMVLLQPGISPNAIIRKPAVKTLATLVANAVKEGSPRLNRAPTVQDNASKGYTITSVWQAGGQIFQPLVTPDNNSAVWRATFSNNGLPVDIFTVIKTKSSGGLDLVRAAYGTGPAIDISVTVLGGTIVSTIYFLATGKIDIATLESKLAVMDTDTLALITRVYDQTGNNNHASSISSTTGTSTLTAGSNVLTIAAGSVIGAVGVGQLVTITSGGGAVSLPAGTTIISVGTGLGEAGTYNLSASATGSGTTSSAVLSLVDNPLVLDWDFAYNDYIITSDLRNAVVFRGLRFPFFMTSAQDNYGMFAVGRATGTADVNSGVVMSLGDWRTTGKQSNLFVQSGAAMAVNNNPGSASTSLTSFESGKCVIGSVSSAGAQKLFCNDSASSSGAAGNTILNSGFLGRWYNDSGHSIFRFRTYCITDNTITASQQDAYKRYAYRTFNIKPQIRNQVFLLGDSRMSSVTQQVERQNTAAILMTNYLRNQAKVYGMSSSGFTSAQLLVNNVPQILNIASQIGTTNVVILLIGVNDFLVSNLSVAQSLTNIKAVILALKTNLSIKVILIAELSTTQKNGAADSNVPLLRTAILSAGSSEMGCDVIIDLSTFAPINTPTNTLFYPDGLHPSSAIMNAILSIVAPVVDNYLDA